MLKSIIFIVKSFLGNFYRHWAIFSGHTEGDKQPDWTNSWTCMARCHACAGLFFALSYTKANLFSFVCHSSGCSTKKNNQDVSMHRTWIVREEGDRADHHLHSQSVFRVICCRRPHTILHPSNLNYIL